MFWANLFYMILVTTFTGSILTVAWFVTSYLLDKTESEQDGCNILDNTSYIYDYKID